MGFKRKTLVLEWPEGSEFHGLEVRARSASVGAAFAIVNSDKGGVEKAELTMRALAGCPGGCTQEHDELPPGQEHYASRLVSWNLEEEDGEPVPATYEGLMSVGLDLAKEVTDAWLHVVLGDPGPLEQPNSNDGGLPAGVSIPMESLSADPLP